MDKRENILVNAFNIAYRLDIGCHDNVPSLSAGHMSFSICDRAIETLPEIWRISKVFPKQDPT